MSPLHPSCVLPVFVCTQDQALAREITVYLEDRFRVRHVDHAALLSGQLASTSNVQVILDLQSPGALDLLRAQGSKRPDIEWMALGMPGSQPLLEAEAMGTCGVEDLPLNRTRFQSHVVKAQRQLMLQIENAGLRGEVAQRQTGLTPPSPMPAPGGAAPAATSTSPTPIAQPLRAFSRNLRHSQNMDNLMESIVESVSGACLASRVGLFARRPGDQGFRLYAGMRCLERTWAGHYEPHDPLVRWLEINACQVVRGHLPHIENVYDRVMLQHELDGLGAEIILPLQGRNQLWGWIFLGQRGTGAPYSYADLEQLLILADHVSTTLENAILYEEAAMQKTMAETLLHSIPTGIVSVTRDGAISAISSAAEALLGVRAEEVRHQSAGALGSRMEDVLLRALHVDLDVAPEEWTDVPSQRFLRVEARRLTNDRETLGAVAFIQDITEQRRLQEKEEQIERMTFWSDLAAHVSHEVRNPLQAINTYAQLLPLRYEDDEFRSDFSRIVTSEVDRVNQLINRISAFAEPPQLKFAPLRIEEVIHAAIRTAQSNEPYTTLPIRTICETDVPSISGDAQALTDCFAQILVNACEATYDLGCPDIRVRVHCAHRDSDRVCVTVLDNGPGIATGAEQKVFSPFCSSKPNRMGLGLPIAKRTIIDHNGSIDIRSASEGTEVAIQLPSCRNEVAVQ